jgi:hypothetical protein
MDSDQLQCLEIWNEIDNNLPDHGTNPTTSNLDGNWSGWSNGKFSFGSKGMDCWPIVNYVANHIQPKNILEIGFNAGHSASMWLTKTSANITSVDIKFGICHQLGSELLKKKFPDRFNFIHCDSTKVYDQIKDNYYDLIIVDGGHGKDVCLSDCNLALKLGAKYMLVDDIIVMKDVRDGVDDFIQSNKTTIKFIKKWNIAWGIILYKFVETSNLQLPNVNAQYGIDNHFKDVTERLVLHFRIGDKLCISKSCEFNDYFGDPCFNKIKVLILEINGITHTIDENRDTDLEFDL